MNIHVDYRHPLTQEEALRRAQSVVGEYGSKVKADIQWDGSTATFKGTGFRGKAKVLDQLIALDLELGLLLRPLKSKIEERIGSTLRKRFS